MRHRAWDRLALAYALLASAVRRRRRWVGAVAVLVAVAAAGLLLPRSDGTATAAGPRPMLVAGGPSADDLLDARSPGGRPDGALYQTKPQRALPSAPRQRVLSTVREHPPLAPAVAVAPPPFATPAPPIFARNFVPPAVLPQSFLDPVPVPVIGPLPSATSGGGGNPGQPGNPGSSSGGPGTPPPVSGVPEPSTWVTMVAGLGLLGAALRRARRSARATG